MKKFIVCSVFACLVITAQVFAGQGDRYVNMRVFATDARVAKMVKDPTHASNYAYFTVWDSIAIVASPAYATFHFTNGDTMQCYMWGQVLIPHTYEFNVAMFDSVHIVRPDTTTAVNGYISRKVKRR